MRQQIQPWRRPPDWPRAPEWHSPWGDRWFWCYYRRTGRAVPAAPECPPAPSSVPSRRTFDSSLIWLPGWRRPRIVAAGCGSDLADWNLLWNEAPGETQKNCNTLNATSYWANEFYRYNPRIWGERYWNNEIPRKHSPPFYPCEACNNSTFRWWRYWPCPVEDSASRGRCGRNLPSLSVHQSDWTSRNVPRRACAADWAAEACSPAESGIFWAARKRWRRCQRRWWWWFLRFSPTMVCSPSAWLTAVVVAVALPTDRNVP